MASEGEMFLIAVYVDDIVLPAKDSKKMVDIEQELLTNFKQEIWEYCIISWESESHRMRLLEGFGLDNNNTQRIS